MAAAVQDAPVFVDAAHAGEHLLLEHVYLPVRTHHRIAALHGFVRNRHAFRIQDIHDFLENPWAAESGTPHHDGIHPVAVETLTGTFGRGYVAIADDGNRHARIVFHLADERPVRFAGVHLRPGTAVYGQRPDTAILKAFGQIHNHLAAFVPSQTGFHRDGNVHGIHHGPRDFQHLGNILQHAGPGSLARHALHGATEIQVEHVGTGTFHHDTGRIGHRTRFLAVNLDGHGALVITHRQFLQTAVHHAHQGICRHKLGIYHRRAETLA